MKALSICSGIEAASVAWEEIGIDVVAVSEIDRFPSKVLKHRYPNKPNLGDFTKITHEQIQEITGGTGIDVLIGGPPCQEFSLAGNRGGIDTSRGGLTLEYARLLAILRPKWMVYENVPGLYQGDSKRGFAQFLGLLTGQNVEAPEKFRNSGVIPGIESAYSVAWRSLDAQYFGLAQRRERVFVVGHLGADWRRSAAVLFDRESLQRNPPKSKKKRKETSGSAANGIGGSDQKGYEIGPKGAEVVDVSTTLDTRCKDGPIRNQTGMAVVGISEYKEQSPTLRATGGDIGGGSEAIIVFTQNTRDEVRDLKNVAGCLGANEGMKQPTAATLNASFGRLHGVSGQDSDHGHSHLIPSHSTVRRLTPVECARLQGFPDNWTKIPWRNKPIENCPDGSQYKAYGNSMAVPVIKWIGERILMVDKITTSRA